MPMKPLLGGANGLFTNRLALYMLFHPYEEVKIGKFRFSFTPGIIPRRKEKIAKSVGDAVGKEVLGEKEILQVLSRERVLNPLRYLCRKKFSSLQNFFTEEETVSGLTNILISFLREQFLV